MGSDELVSDREGEGGKGMILFLLLQPLFQPLVPKIMLTIKSLIQTDEVLLSVRFSSPLPSPLSAMSPFLPPPPPSPLLPSPLFSPPCHPSFHTPYLFPPLPSPSPIPLLSFSPPFLPSLFLLPSLSPSLG